MMSVTCKPSSGTSRFTMYASFMLLSVAFLKEMGFFNTSNGDYTGVRGLSNKPVAQDHELQTVAQDHELQTAAQNHELQTIHALTFRQQQLTRWPNQPTLHGQTFIATPAYNLGGPDANMTYAEYLATSGQSTNTADDAAKTLDVWNSWTASTEQSKVYFERPRGTVVKVLLMTKDEGPLIKQWILYHGELLGFENLYILDGSKEVESVAFLKYAHDKLGVNVIFTPANLNQIGAEINYIFRELVKSADVLIKVDTDEFLTMDTGDAACSYVTEPSSKAAGQSDCTLSPYGLSEFLQTSPDLHGRLDGHAMRILRQYQSIMMNQSECDDGKADDLGSFSYIKIDDCGVYKQVHDARTFLGENLGGHLIEGNNISPWKNSATVSPFGIMHFHNRCRRMEVESSRKAMIGHGFIKESDTPEMVIAEYKKKVPALADDLCLATCDHFKVASCHKIVDYLKYWGGCPDDDNLYDHGDGVKNPEFAHFLHQTLVKYAPLSIL